MPFTEFRFLNGSTTPQSADAILDDTVAGTTAPVGVPPIPVPPQTQAVAPLPVPPPPPNANRISAAQVTTTGPVLQLPPGTFVDAPPGEHFCRVAVVLSENMPMHPPAAVVVGETNTGHVVSGTLQ